MSDTLPSPCPMPRVVRDVLDLALDIYREELGRSPNHDVTVAWVRAQPVDDAAQEPAAREGEVAG